MLPDVGTSEVAIIIIIIIIIIKITLIANIYISVYLCGNTLRLKYTIRVNLHPIKTNF